MSRIVSGAASPAIDFADVRAAADRIHGHVHRTPVLTSRILDEISGARLHLKCESFQRAGAFKTRGAMNTVLGLDAAALERGVATHSSGNHGAALALAGASRGARVTVVMPSNSNPLKRAAVAHYGAEIVTCEPTQASREETLAAIVAEGGQTVVHPYDDPRVMAGQGTAALELLEQVADLDAVVAPVGGGGLLSGTAIAVKGHAPKVTVIGAEPAGADDTFRSFAAGHIEPLGTPDTIADGLRTRVGELTFPIIAAHVERIVTVSENEIVAAMRLVWERMKIIIEPSSAVAIAAVLATREAFAGQRVGVVISGGNVDLDALPW